MPRLSPRQLDALRTCVRSDLSGMPDQQIEQALNESLAELPATAAEDFMKTLGSLGKALGPTLERAAPSMVQGAATGATVGGPWGALIGAGTGLASSAAGKPDKPAPAASTPTTGATAPTPPIVPQAPALPTGQSAAATIVALLDNPIVRKALLSQVLGSSGGQQVPTPAGVNVRPAAINNVLTHLLANASEGLPESESVSDQSYLMGESGEYLVDPASPEQQAALVLSYLRPARHTDPQSNSGESMDDSVEFIAEEVEWLPDDSIESESVEWQESDGNEEIVEFY